MSENVLSPKLMRKIAFGYSTRCNVKCEHCVAADGDGKSQMMELESAMDCIRELAAAQVTGISFTAGEPLLYRDDICVLLSLCRELGIYTRLVSNSFWAGTPDQADTCLEQLKNAGLSQLRLSYSRWHQKNIARENVLNAARSCVKHGLNYFISFVTDFTREDDTYEEYLRKHGLLFFPEPVIFSGRAAKFDRLPIHTDYQENRCPMNPYLSPEFDLYACCDAGSHFNRTNFFHLGNLKEKSAAELLQKSETNTLYNLIRSSGISTIASYAGFRAREIVKYRKCELCEKMFNSGETLKSLQSAASTDLQKWHR